MESNMEPGLAVDAISYSYGAGKALDRVSFSVPPGVFTVLLGANGAGKTTLFSLITRLFRPREGSIRILGHDLHLRPGLALRRLGVVFQARTLDLDLSVRQNLLYHASLHGVSGEEARLRIAEVLAAVDLSDRLSDRARSLSGGQMRRLEIARALLHRPAVLLLDEATVGLDVRSRLAIQKIIRALVSEKKLSVLWATHLVDEVEQGDTVLVLDRGRLAAEGLSSELQKRAGAKSMQEAFMGMTERAREGVPAGTPDVAAEGGEVL
jgi:ABC-2 type transport system ATP-binding protein